jgi:hypothetical protein
MRPAVLITPPLGPDFFVEPSHSSAAPAVMFPAAVRLPHNVNPNNARQAPIQSTRPLVSHNAWDSSILARDLHHAAIVSAPGAR